MYINRDEAEELIREAIDDYLPDEILQEIVNSIYGEEYVIIDDEFLEEDD